MFYHLLWKQVCIIINEAMGSLMIIQKANHPSKEHQHVDFVGTLWALDGPATFSEASRSQGKGKVLTTVCEVEAFPWTMLGGSKLGGVGGLSQPGRVNGHGPCGI